MVVDKEGGSGKRVPVDFRRLNEVTKPDKYQMTRIDDIMDTLHGSKYFSKLDAKDGFLQIDLEEKDQIKTSFRTKKGCYCFVKMPFGLINAPATYQRAMDNALSDYLWKFVVVYMDDCLVFSENMEDHKKHLKLVKDRLWERNILLNSDKCDYFKEEIKFLGHIIDKNGLNQIQKESVQLITVDLLRPRKKCKVFLA